MGNQQVQYKTTQTVMSITDEDELKILEHMKTSSFSSMEILGRGGFGRVYTAQFIKNNCTRYAVKIVKNHLLTKKFIKTEREILTKAKNDNQDFIINLNIYFEHSPYSFFVLDLMYCDLMHLMRKYIFTESGIRFYLEQIITALDYLHSIGVIYKDLKPENVLINYDGHIKLADFGFCEFKEVSSTYGGTKRFMAPEVHMKETFGKEVDWWSMGVLIYLMLFRKYPFRENEEQTVLQVILDNKLDLTNCKASPEVIDLMQRLLKLDRKKRIGWKGSNFIKKHRFFKSTCWSDVLNRSNTPPVIPSKQEEDGEKTK